MTKLVLGLALLTAVAAATGQQNSDAKPAVPIDAVPGILDAFQSHSVVALSDAHGNQQAQDFLISLVRDPRFAATVNDIVVEWGNARYQDVIDRFVGGEDVPYDVLRQVWRDTTQASAATDLPIYEAFYRAVRAVNGALPKPRQLRVLLGDPPIAWERVRNREDHRKWVELREAYPASLIQIEVIAKQRRALLVYGHGHFQRKNVLSNFDMSDWRAQTIVSLLEMAGTHVFVIWRDASLASIQPDIGSWPTPRIAAIRGTALGSVDFSKYFSPGGDRFTVRDGKMATLPRREWAQMRAEEQIDAVLYLGPPSSITMSTWSPALCADRGYLDLRFNRIALVGLPPGEAEALKKHCVSVGAK